MLSNEIICYPVHLHGSRNSKLYGALVFQNIKTHDIVIIVSRAYRTSRGDPLGVSTLSTEIKNLCEGKKTSSSIDEIVNHLFNEVLNCRYYN